LGEGLAGIINKARMGWKSDKGGFNSANSIAVFKLNKNIKITKNKNL
jgi:hypothetical protein